MCNFRFLTHKYLTDLLVIIFSWIKKLNLADLHLLLSIKDLVEVL